MSAYGGVFELQKAIYTRLKDDTTFADKITTTGKPVRLFSNPAEVSEITYPYAQIGDHTSVDWSSKTFDGVEITINIHVYTQTGDNEAAEDLLDDIHRLLHKQGSFMTLTGFDLVLIRFDNLAMVTLEETDNQTTHHGVMRFRALVVKQ